MTSSAYIMESYNNMATGKSSKGIIFGTLIIIVCLFYLKGLYSKPDGDDKKREAFLNAEVCVKNNLKAPATAKFPPYVKGCVTSSDNITFVISSFVDVQNTYGALLRENWRCELKWKGGDLQDLSNWEIIDVNIDEQIY